MRTARKATADLLQGKAENEHGVLRERAGALTAEPTTPARAAEEGRLWPPYVAGLLTFLILAVALPVHEPDGPSRVAVDSRQESASASAAAVGQTIDAWVDSLAPIAATIESDLARHTPVSLKPHAAGSRSSLLVVKRSTRAVIAQSGRPLPLPVPIDRLPAGSGLFPVDTGQGNLILAYQPVAGDYLLIGAYNSDDLAADLPSADGSAAAPQRTWLIDAAGTVLAASDQAARPVPLPADLADAARSAAARRASSFTRLLAVAPRASTARPAMSKPFWQVTAWAAVPGRGPAGDTRWGIISTRPVAAQYRPYDGHGPVSVTASLAGLTLLVFGWLYLVLFRPLAATRRAGRRLAAGSREHPVKHPARFGEHAAITHAMEQIRLDLCEGSTPNRPTQGRVFRHGLLAWMAGFLAFLSFAGWLLTAAPYREPATVPPDVVADQQARTGLVAAHLRTSLGGALSDLRTLAAEMTTAADPQQRREALDRLVKTQSRFAGTALRESDGMVVARAGADIDLTRLPAVDKPIVMETAAGDGSPRVLAAYPVDGGPGALLVAELSPTVLLRALDLAGPGTTRLVAAGRRGHAAGHDGAAFHLAEGKKLRAEANARTAGSSVSPDGRQVVTWAHVTGIGATDSLGWTVVTDRLVTTLAVPATALDPAAGTLALLVAATALVVFGWLYACVVAPLGQVATAARRLTARRYDQPIVPRRNDPIGLLAGDLERLRRDLADGTGQR